MTVKKQDEDAPLNFFNQVELSYYNTSIDSFGAYFGCVTTLYLNMCSYYQDLNKQLKFKLNINKQRPTKCFQQFFGGLKVTFCHSLSQKKGTKLTFLD